jgi:hypothetical protein
MTNTCSVCGANLDMVGRAHRCIPRVQPGSASVETDKLPGSVATYKYRDADKWRTYMRAYMRKRREKEVTC